MKYTPAPIAIFCYKRLRLLKKLLKSLEKNKEAKLSTVFFFSDYSQNKKNLKEIKKIRELIKSSDGFKRKIIILRDKNYGLKKNILTGIDYVFTKYKKIIVLEDDLEVSKNFLQTTNILLEKYKNNSSISTITGYSFPINKVEEADIKKNFFLLKRPSSWGWATWKKKWIDLKKIDISIEPNTKNYGNDLKIMSIKKKNGNFKSWAYDWTMKHLKSHKFCIYPKFSLIKNNGFDNYATNNFFKKKNFFYKIKSINFKNYLYQFENKKIKNLSRSNYDMNIIIFLIKFIFFKLFYEISRNTK